MKKVRTILFAMAIMGFVVWSHDPIDDTANFIVGGSVPGTKIVLGFWPTIGFIGILFWILKRAITSIRLQLLEHTAKQISAEKMNQDFKEKNTAVLEPSQRAVIAAPTRPTTVR